MQHTKRNILIISIRLVFMQTSKSFLLKSHKEILQILSIYNLWQGKKYTMLKNKSIPSPVIFSKSKTS